MIIGIMLICLLLLDTVVVIVLNIFGIRRLHKELLEKEHIENSFIKELHEGNVKRYIKIKWTDVRELSLIACLLIVCLYYMIKVSL